jgi:hypothetical protein
MGCAGSCIQMSNAAALQQVHKHTHMCVLLSRCCCKRVSGIKINGGQKVERMQQQHQ